MRKLNNKGITTIEVIVCFVLVFMMTMSMYSTVSSYNEKRILEQYKEEIYTYKNLLTKDIQDDFIKIGLTHAEYKKEIVGTKTTHTLNCTLKDGSKRRLVVEQVFGSSPYRLDGADVDEYFMIKYGTPEDDLMEYPLPDLGESVILDQGAKHTVKDLSINNVWATISSSNILNLYIGFYHPELTTRYGIQIVCPIDYITSGSDGTGTFDLY